MFQPGCFKPLSRCAHHHRKIYLRFGTQYRDLLHRYTTHIVYGDLERRGRKKVVERRGAVLGVGNDGPLWSGWALCVHSSLLA